ncbi:uncharacterized protein [Euphorbia lathyris]|uniref:uncharacterized protein n=1 Tax=Euphorbia lathyris TaxID=212925 RepID=UPI00331404CB
MMGFFNKIELLLLLILLQFLLLPPLDAHPSTSATTDFIQGLNATDSKLGGEMTTKLTSSKHVVSVERKGGGGGGHGGGHTMGGGRGGGGRAIGGRGGGEARGSSNQVRRGPNLIPLYAAGALPHRQNQYHRNSSGHVKMKILRI